MSDIFDRMDQAMKRGGKHRFGLLGLVINDVVMGKVDEGFTYTIDGFEDKDGNPYEFKGKSLAIGDEDKITQHVIMFMDQEDKSGNSYRMFRDDVVFGKSVLNYFAPSAKKVFGSKWHRILSGEPHPAEIEEVSFQERAKNGETYERRAWKVIRKFDSVEAMREGREKYFGDMKAVAGETGEEMPISKATFEEARKLYLQLGKDQSVFKDVVSGHPKFKNLPFDRLLADVAFETAGEQGAFPGDTV